MSDASSIEMIATGLHFLELLQEVVVMRRWILHAWVLMSNGSRHPAGVLRFWGGVAMYRWWRLRRYHRLPSGTPPACWGMGQCRPMIPPMIPGMKA